MDFIFLALALQLLILAILIILSSDFSQIRVSSITIFKLSYLLTFLHSYIDKSGLDVGVDPRETDLAKEAFPSTHFVDYEIESGISDPAKKNSHHINSVRETTSDRNSEESNWSRFATCQIFVFFSTKTMKITSDLKIGLGKFARNWIHGNAENFDFTNSDSVYGSQLGVVQNQMRNSRIELGAARVKVDVMVSPFRSLDPIILIHRKIQRKILKIEAVKLRNGIGKTLSPIYEIPELENGSFSNED